MRVRNIPDLPENVDVKLLQSNMRLYSDKQIEFIKKHIKFKGRTRRIVDSANLIWPLKHAVFHLGERYFAVINGKDFLLGGGAFGRVKLAQDLDTGEWVALKVQKYNSDMSIRQREAAREIYKAELNALIKSGNMLYSANQEDAIAFTRRVQNKHQTSKHCYLVMKLAKGLGYNDARLLNCPPAIKLELSLSLLMLVVSNLTRKLIHRDLKPEHFLFELTTGNASLIDYSLALDKSLHLHNDKTVLCGSPAYVDYDLLKKESITCADYGEHTELYAAAIVIGELWCVLEPEWMSRCSYLKIPNYGLHARKDGVHEVDAQHEMIRLQREIQRFLRSILDYPPQSRPSLVDTVKFIRELKASLPPSLQKHQVGVLDVANLSLPLTQDSLTELKQFPLLLLLDSSSRLTDIELMRIRAYLNKQEAVYVGNQVLSGPLAEAHVYINTVNASHQTRHLSMVGSPEISRHVRVSASRVAMFHRLNGREYHDALLKAKQSESSEDSAESMQRSVYII